MRKRSKWSQPLLCKRRMSHSSSNTKTLTSMERGVHLVFKPKTPSLSRRALGVSKQGKRHKCKILKYLILNRTRFLKSLRILKDHFCRGALLLSSIDQINNFRKKIMTGTMSKSHQDEETCFQRRN